MAATGSTSVRTGGADPAMALSGRSRPGAYLADPPGQSIGARSHHDRDIFGTGVETCIKDMAPTKSRRAAVGAHRRSIHGEGPRIVRHELVAQKRQAGRSTMPPKRSPKIRAARRAGHDGALGLAGLTLIRKSTSLPPRSRLDLAHSAGSVLAATGPSSGRGHLTGRCSGQERRQRFVVAFAPLI